MKVTWRAISGIALSLSVLSCWSDEPLATVGDEVGKPLPHVVMHKNPGCGCCDLWADHMRSFNFSVEIIEDPQIYDLKVTRGIPQPLFSCHTALVDGYFVEGHVPANDVLTLLELKPEGVAGISVPGMPLGSPGMEHPQPQSFNTIALLTNGDAYVFANHVAGEDFSAEDD